MALSYGAPLPLVREEKDFAELATGGFIYAPHIAPLDVYEADAVAVARRFIGAPYLWGGREATGLDCSALVQLALMACGQACPRDSDMQEAVLGQAVSAPAYGDIVFGKAMSALYPVIIFCCTPMPIIWRWHKSRLMPLARALKRRAAAMSRPSKGCKLH